VDRCGDEAAWWKKAGINPTIGSRAMAPNTPLAAITRRIVRRRFHLAFRAASTHQ